MKTVKKGTQKDANKTISEELLVSVRNALYKLKDYLDNIKFNKDDDFNEQNKKSVSIITTCEKMGKAIETLAILEKKVATEEQIKSKTRGGYDNGMFEG